MQQSKLNRNFLFGALSGTIATISMTAAMELLRFALLRSRSGTFPPRQVAQGMIDRLGLRKVLRPYGETGIATTTAVSHFGFGGSAGAIYGAVLPVLRGSCPGKPLDHPINQPTQRSLRTAAAWGMAFGIIVWTGSYFGLLPALGILKPQGDYPIRKNLILGLSHLVWGTSTGLLFHWLQLRENQKAVISSAKRVNGHVPLMA